MPPKCPPWTFVVADGLNAFMWWWIFVHLWYQPGHVFVCANFVFILSFKSNNYFYIACVHYYFTFIESALVKWVYVFQNSYLENYFTYSGILLTFSFINHCLFFIMILLDNNMLFLKMSQIIFTYFNYFLFLKNFIWIHRS